MKHVFTARPKKAPKIAIAVIVLVCAAAAALPAGAAEQPAVPVTIGTCWPPDYTILAEEGGGMDQEFYAEFRDGVWQDGAPMGGTLYWAVQFGEESESLVRDEDGAFHTGTFLHLYGLNNGSVRALAVPEYVPEEEASILAYARSQPLGVRTWTVQVVPSEVRPVIEVLPGSGLHLRTVSGHTYVCGLSVLTAAQNTPSVVASKFAYFEGTNPLFLSGGYEMDRSGTIGTGTIYELTAYGPHAVFAVTGDVTGDGRGSISDLVRMADALTGETSLTEAEMLAVGSEGSELTLTDLVREAVLVGQVNSSSD